MLLYGDITQLGDLISGDVVSEPRTGDAKLSEH